MEPLQLHPCPTPRRRPPPSCRIKQHREVRFHSGSARWKTTNTFSPLAQLPRSVSYLSGALAPELSRNNTVSYFLRPKSDLMLRDLFWHTRDTPLPLAPLHLLVFLLMSLSLTPVFSLWLGFSQIADRAALAKDAVQVVSVAAGHTGKHFFEVQWDLCNIIKSTFHAVGSRCTSTAHIH